MKNYVLVVVDMQGHFASAKNDYTIRNVITSIKKAKKDNAVIIVLEYFGCGPTLSRIKKHLNGYDKVTYAMKSSDGGGEEVIDKMHFKNIDFIQNIRVCGVNISFCVSETVRELVDDYGKNVEVIKRACNCSRDRKVAFESDRYTTIYRHEQVTLI